MTVAFFGHRDTPNDIMPRLELEIQRLIEENGDITFLVGTHGAFDRMVQRTLKRATKKYPHIKHIINLAIQ